MAAGKIVPEARTGPEAGREEGREATMRKVAITLLALMTFGMFVDLLPPLAELVGIWGGPWEVTGWFIVSTLPLTGAALILVPLAIWLERRATGGRRLEGAACYLLTATLLLFALKSLVYSWSHLQGGRYLSVPLLVAAAVILATGVWLEYRAKGEGTGQRTGRYLLLLLPVPFRVELLVYGMRNYWGG